jgi:iron complex transport system ATP-binding protein
VHSVLDIQDLACGYRGRPVLADICLTARRGEVLALIGPNGAGKTTLLRAMSRLLRPSAGTLLLDGQDLWQMEPRALARRLALAPQTNATDWPLTVEQVVALGRAPHRGWLLPFSATDRDAVAHAMRRMEIEVLRARLIRTLSGGEQRRVILARALAQAADILLLDEPTASLDLRFQMEILQLVRELAHADQRAVVITLHDLNHAALCADRIALLAHGQLQALGAVEEVLTPNQIEQAYGVSVVVTRHPVDGTPLVTPLSALLARSPADPALEPAAVSWTEQL